jgi:hypothetical protein
MACQSGSISELRPIKDFSRILSIRQIRRDENRIIQSTRKISLQKRHRLLTTRNIFTSQDPQLNSQRTPQSRPTWPSTRILSKPSPSSLHVHAQSDLSQCHRAELVRSRVCAPNGRDLSGVVRGSVFEELRVGERGVVAVAPDSLAAGELDC